MPKAYEHVGSAIETNQEFELSFVKNRLRGEEEKRHKMATYDNKNTFLCYYCLKPDHKKYQCRARQLI